MRAKIEDPPRNTSSMNIGNRCSFIRELSAGPAVVSQVNGSDNAGGRRAFQKSTEIGLAVHVSASVWRNQEDDTMFRHSMLSLALLPLMLTSMAAAQETPPPRDTVPKTAPPARLVGGVEIVTLKEAGDMALPYDKYRGIQYRSSKEFFEQYPDRSKTPSGLYLLDTELVPRQLPEILVRNGLALGPNGSLVNQKGEKAVMVLGYRLVAVRKKQGSLPGSIFGLLAPSSALAATPFPLEWVSAWYSWSDDEGFCRSITTSTGADAWGPIIDPWGDRVHTNIQQIEAYANAAGSPNDQKCNNCGWDSAQATNNFGCFWPAHGGGEWGWADTKDGSFNWSYSW
jgi:hypothetical protein